LANSDVKIQISVDAKTGQLKVLNQDLKSLDTNTTTNSTSIEKLKNKINTLGVALVGATAGVGGFVSAGIDLNTSSENATLAIASLISANADNVSTTGEALTAVEKYNLATKDTVNVLQSLKDINVQTAQTLGETTDIFKTIYGSVVNVGGSMEDVVELTKLLGLAASVSGVEFDSFISVVDGVADGSYDASSEFGKFLSTIELTPTAIQNSTDKIELIKSKLASFEPLGEVVQNSFDGIKSNLQNTWDDMLETATKPIFDEFKTSMGDVNTFLTQNSSTVVEYFQKSYYAIKPIFHLIQNGFGLIGLAIDTFKPSITQWANYFEYQGLRVVSFFESSLSSINSLGLDMASGWNDLLPDFAPKSLKIDTSGFEQSISQSDEKIKAFDISMNNLILENAELEKSLIATREEFVANQKQIDFGGYDKYIQSLKDAKKETTEVKKGVIDLEHQVETSAKGELKIKKKVSQETKDFIKEEQQANRTKFEQAVYLRDEELKKHGNNATAKELIEKKFNKTVIELYEAEQKEFEKTKLEEQKANKAFFDKYGVNINELEVDWSNTLTDITKTHDTSLNTDMKKDIEYFTNDSSGAVQKSMGFMDTNWSDTLGDITKTHDTSLNTDMKKDIEYFTNDSNGAVQKSMGFMDTNWSDTLSDITDDFDTSLNTTMNGYIKHFANGQDGATVTFLGDMKNNWNTVMQDIADDYKLTNEKMQGYMTSFVGSMTSSLSGSISQGLKGEFDSASDFFKEFGTSVLNTVIGMASKVAAQQLVLSITGNNSDGLLSTIFSIMGFANGTVWGDGKYGVVGGTSPFRGDDFRNDTVPALISAGEAVIPRTAVEANRPIIEQILQGRTVSKFANGTIADVKFDNQGRPYSQADGLYRFWNPLKDSWGLGTGGGKKAVDKITPESVKDALKSAEDVAKAFVDGGTSLLTTGKLPKDFNSLSDFDDKVLQPVKDAFISTIAGVLSPLMKHPELAWLAQLAIALNPTTTWLTPYMLTADLLSMGITLGSGGDLGDALKGAGVSGLVSAATAGIFQTAPVEQLGFIETIKQYGTDMSVNMANIVNEGKSLMSDPAQYLGDAFEYTFTNGGSEFSEAMEEALLNGEYMTEAMKESYLGGLGTSNMTWLEKAKDGLIRWGEMAFEYGADKIQILGDYVADPSQLYDLMHNYIQSAFNNLISSIQNLVSHPEIFGAFAGAMSQNLLKHDGEYPANTSISLMSVADTNPLKENLNNFKGFSTGGFTGYGRDDEIAGIVHKNEVVFNHQDIQRHGGVANVESMRKGDGYDFAKLEDKLDELVDINIQLLSTLKKQKRVLEMSA
jgi:hypothetical protein